MRDEPCLGNSSGKSSFYSECGLSVICFIFIFWEISRHANVSRILQNIYVFTTFYLFHVYILLYPFFPFMVVKLQRIVFG